MAARRTLYRAHMGSDHEAEIRASVGAHHDLGPGYDDAVAEGLVERIGAEIDKRIEAQLRRYGAPFGPVAVPRVTAAFRYVPPGYAPPGSVRRPGVRGSPGTCAAGYVPAGIRRRGYPGIRDIPGTRVTRRPCRPGYQAPVPAARPPHGPPDSAAWR